MELHVGALDPWLFTTDDPTAWNGYIDFGEFYGK